MLDLTGNLHYNINTISFETENHIFGGSSKWQKRQKVQSIYVLVAIQDRMELRLARTVARLLKRAKGSGNNMFD